MCRPVAAMGGGRDKQGQLQQRRRTAIEIEDSCLVGRSYRTYGKLETRRKTFRLRFYGNELLGFCTKAL